MKGSTRSFKMGFTVASIASVLVACQNVAERCDIGRSEYPLQHTLPDGRSVELHWDGNRCGTDARGVWVRTESDGDSCGLGYYCQRLPRSGGGR